MAITLEQAKLNTQTDYDPTIIDEFRKSSAILDSLVFDTAVNPAGGGATLSYGYRRLKTQRGAAFRELNHEYTPEHVETEQLTVNLAPIGGSFQIDRVLAHLGQATSDEVSLQIAQTIKASTAKFADAVINGDIAQDANGFDGLDKALLGSTTELNAAGSKDWSAFTSADAAMAVLDDLDELTGALDGPATMLIGNTRALAKVRAAARRANMYVKAPVEGLADNAGRPIEREQVGNLILIDAGAKPGSNDPIINVAGGLTSLYAVRCGLDGFHAVTTTTGELVKTWLPDFTTAGAVKTGEVELGPVAVALKATKAAAVLRNVKVA
ncbi:phage capsid protein [Corynebacterium striatum]|uniref:Phage capsid protein n=1 Tax=Corynebacterium striatum TaxID=43770 RepID=A0A2Z2IVQ8_CORST|nr:MULTISPECIES: phage capsid protein [Corynebacterium]ART20070.1 phage capsid protein [Corynebacterium striatum]MCK6161562.1 phage capsid protein [Corynebacterium simulans]